MNKDKRIRKNITIDILLEEKTQAIANLWIANGRIDETDWN